MVSGPESSRAKEQVDRPGGLWGRGWTIKRALGTWLDDQEGLGGVAGRSGSGFIVFAAYLVQWKPSSGVFAFCLYRYFASVCDKQSEAVTYFWSGFLFKL